MKLKRHKVRLWGAQYTVTPRLVEKIFGDGQQHLALWPISSRPEYYVVRIDSQYDLDADESFDVLDDIYDAIEDEFPCRCVRGTCQQCHVFPHANCLDDGSTWAAIDVSKELALREMKK